MVHWYADTEKELQMKKCLTCGMENSDDSLFCAGCGTRLPAAPEPEAAQEQNVAAPEPEAVQERT